MKKSYSIVIIVLLVVLTAVNLYFVFGRNTSCEGNCSHSGESCCYVSKTISLNEEQKEQYSQIKHKYQKRAILVADSLHISQEVLMKEMMSAEQDSLRLREMEAKISYYQAQLLHLSVEQYYNIKTILTPEQIPALDRLFAQILICRPTCNHRDDDGGTIPHLN